jgi:hypothetical protein
LSGVTIWSGLDTKAKHDDFVAKPSADTSTAGTDAQRRTNLLALATGGVALITGAVGIFAVRWSAGPNPSASATVSMRF